MFHFQWWKLSRRLKPQPLLHYWLDSVRSWKTTLPTPVLLKLWTPTLSLQLQAIKEILESHSSIADLVQQIGIFTLVPQGGGFQAERIAEMLEDQYGASSLPKIFESQVSKWRRRTVPIGGTSNLFFILYVIMRGKQKCFSAENGMAGGGHLE